MLFPTLLILLVTTVQGQSIQASVSAPSAFKIPSTPTASSHTLSLTKQKSAKGYNVRSAAWLLFNSNPNCIGPAPHTTTLQSILGGQELVTSITLGNFTYKAIVDTGSSDTWVVETGFQCLNQTNGADIPEEGCGFGPTFTIDSTFEQIPDENFNITYGSGQFLTGIMGFEQVEIAGLSVRQEVAVVNVAAWPGDNVTSGLVGLAYPGLTSAFSGTNPHNDNNNKSVIYNPLFTTLSTKGLISPVFSLAIFRNVSGPSGYLSLGGTPPVEVTSNYTSTPILVTHIDGYPVAFDFYTIATDSTIVNGQAFPGGNYIVDSGTTVILAPTDLANTINNAFDPPAQFNEDEGVFIVDCNATTPSLAIQINGTNFNINPLDLIIQTGTDPDVCTTGVTNGGNNTAANVFVLGDTFLKNVVAVFDVGAAEMRFAAHEDYASNDPFRK